MVNKMPDDKEIEAYTKKVELLDGKFDKLTELINTVIKSTKPEVEVDANPAQIFVDGMVESNPILKKCNSELKLNADGRIIALHLWDSLNGIQKPNSEVGTPLPPSNDNKGLGGAKRLFQVVRE